MKKNLLTILALGGLLFASSCQMDEPDAGTLTGEVDFSITAGIPSGITTYADPIPAFSHRGGASNLDPKDYTLRYILQVFDEDGKVAYEEEKTPEAGTFGGVTFEARLLAKKYNFVFWADFVKTEGNVEFYNVGNSIDGYNLSNITYKDKNITINDLATDAADAYTKVVEVDLTQASQSLSEPVKLQRPFGKIRLLATDALGEHNKQEERPGEVTIDFKDAVIPSEYNALAQKVAKGVTMKVGKLTFTAVCEDASVNGVTTEYKNSYLLGYSYIFASGEIPSYSIDVEVKGNQVGSGVIGTRSLSSIPVQANKLTTVIGNFYTNEGSIDVKVDDMFDGDDIEVPVTEIFVVTPADDLQKIIDEAEDNAVIKVATGSYPEVVKVTGSKKLTLEAAGPDVVIAGLDHQNNSNLSTIKVKGITFDNSLAKSGWFTGTAPKIYPCVGAWGGNLSFEECKFIVDGNSGKETGVMTWWTTEAGRMSLAFNNCTFEGKDDNSSARAMQIYGYVDLTVTNCTFTTANDYSLKYVGKNGTEAILSNNTVNNSEWFVEIGSEPYKGEGYKVVLNNNTLGKNITPYAEGYIDAITKENVTVETSENVNVIADGLIMNAEGQYVASTDAGIASAISENASIIYLEEGTYIIPDDAKGKTLSFIGTGNPEDTKIATQDDGTYEGCDYSLDGATATFENISINTTSKTYTGYARLNATYKNCIINGTYTLYGKSTFEGCTFNVSGDVYNIWTWGAAEAKFTNCKFNCDGKALLVYNQTLDLTIENCIFNDLGDISGKSAIETGVDAVGAAKYDIKIANTKFYGFDVNATQEGYKNIVGNKNNISKEYLNVIIDGEDVY